MKLCLLLVAACVLPAAGLLAQDTTAPEVSSISLSGPVDITAGPANLTVTLEITDDDTGFKRGTLYLFRADDKYVDTISFESDKRTAGTPQAGTYVIPVEVPGFGPQGTWRIETDVMDVAINTRTYGTGQGDIPYPAPADATFLVTNSGTPDTTGPVITNVTFSPLSGDLTNDPVVITATFDVADTPSGFHSGFIYLDDPNGVTRFDLTALNQFTGANRISGTANNGSYQATGTIPRSAMPGTWEVYLGIRDKVGNYSFSPHVPVTITSSTSATGGLADACDATQFNWFTSGDADWTFQTATTHDGIDAARSGPIGANEESIMEAVITGPGTLTYWWKVSSATDHRLQVDAAGAGNSRAISGSSPWVEVSLNIEPGEQTVTWTYSKDSSPSAGEDAGWVDQVRFVADEDREAPTLQYFKITPNPVNVGHDTVDVTVTFEISDDFSGLTDGTIEIYDADDNNYASLYFGDWQLTHGDAMFGTYEATFTINDSDLEPNGSYLPGIWRAEVSLEDGDANSRSYASYADDFPITGSDQFTVINSAPSSDLGILSIDSFTPNPVDVTVGPQTVTVNFTVSDPDGVLSYGNLFLYRDDGQFVSSYYFDSFYGADNEFSVEMSVPQYAQPGQWRVSFLLVDQDEHETNVSGWIQIPDDDKFDVINTAQVDTTPAEVTSITIAPKVVDTSAGAATVTATVEISDDLSGLSTIFLYFVAPSGAESYQYVNGENIIGGSSGNYRLYGPETFAEPFPVPADAEFTVGPVTGSSFAAFTAGFSLTGNDALPDANPDNDWAPNALEFVLGLNPTVASTPDPALYQISRVGNELHLDFKPAAGLSITENGDFLNVANAAADSPLQVTGETAINLAGPWTKTRPLAVGGGIYRVTLPIGPDVRGFCRLKFVEP